MYKQILQRMRDKTGDTFTPISNWRPRGMLTNSSMLFYLPGLENLYQVNIYSSI